MPIRNWSPQGWASGLLVVAVAMLVAAVSVSHAQLATSPWPMFHHDFTHTGLSTVDTSTNPGKLKWTFAALGEVCSSPVIGSDGTIYFGDSEGLGPCIGGSGSGTVYAVCGETATSGYCRGGPGSEKWAWSTPNGFVTSSPAIGADGTIYVGSDDGNVYALVTNPNPVLGVYAKWVFSTLPISLFTSGEVTSSPAIGADGTIYVGSQGGLFYALNPDGTLKWEVPPNFFPVYV